MLSENQIKILMSFFPEVKEKTSKKIELDTDLSHETVFRNLRYLVKNNYLKKKSVGKTNVYKFIFNDNAFLIYTYFMSKKTDKFKEEHKLLFKRLKEFTALVKARLVVLFGSYVKNTETKTSDIDILLVSNKKAEEEKTRSFETKYGLKINSVVVKTRDFGNIKRDNNAFYKDLVNFGLVLDGIEFFFKEVYDNEKP